MSVRLGSESNHSSVHQTHQNLVYNKLNKIVLVPTYMSVRLDWENNLRSVHQIHQTLVYNKLNHNGPGFNVDECLCG